MSASHLCPVILLLGLGAGLAAYGAPLTEAQAAAWQQWLMPLPKEVSLTGQVTVPVNRLRLQLPANPTQLDRDLAAELAAALGKKCGLKLDLLTAPGPATLVFQRTPAAAKALAGKRNADQGYLITTSETGGAATVTSDALTDVGDYYAMKTLKQLLLATVQGQGAAATVNLPLGRILDWPDLQERGQWGGTCTQDLAWLSDMKFNLIELHAHLTVDDKGVAHATMDEKVMARARRHAVTIVPIIHHLEQLANTGIFKAYPQLAAVGVKPEGNSHPICFSRPEIVTVLSEWMTDLGKIPGVNEVMVWLSEQGQSCQCEQCKKVNPYVAQVRAVTAAWREAKKVCPGLGLRVLLTQGSYSSNDKVLAALPPGVKVSYYHGSLTYNTERKPMIYPLLANYAKQGKWLGVYPTLSSNWLTVAPFSNPEFTHYRLTEFVDKGLSCIVAYVVPTDWYYQVNTAGGLEWAWNAHGRSPQQFAAAWAVRHGLKDPAMFVHWTELIGPPAWDLYASNFPYLEHWGHPTVKIAAGKMKFPLGKSIFAAFKTEDQFARNVAQCQQALAVAQQLGDPQFIYESQIVLDYTQILQSVRELSQILRGQNTLAPEQRPAAKKWFDQCQHSIDQLVATYPLWSHACQPALQGHEPNRFLSTADMMDELGASMGELMEKFGFVDAGKPYRMHQIGAWKSEEFVKQHSQVRRMDVTPFVTSPGKYWFRPIYRSGDLGLVATEVDLVSFPKDKPDQVQEEAVDKHSCHAGAWVKDDVYLLQLKNYDPARGYAVVAHIDVGPSSNGNFFFRKLR